MRHSLLCHPRPRFAGWLCRDIRPLAASGGPLRCARTPARSRHRGCRALICFDHRDHDRRSRGQRHVTTEEGSMRRRQLTLLVAVASFVVGCSGSAATPTNATAAPPVASSTSVAPSETPTPSLSAAPTLIATPSPTPIPGPFGPLKVSISDCNKIGPHIGMATITYTGQASPTNKVLIGTDPNGRCTVGTSRRSAKAHSPRTPTPSSPRSTSHSHMRRRATG